MTETLFPGLESGIHVTEADIALITRGFADDGDELIGYRRVTEICQDRTCSTHGGRSHVHTVAWEFIGHKSMLTVNRRGISVRHQVVHPVEDFARLELSA